MIATALIAAMVVAADFLFYPFGLETAALVFYSAFPAGQRLGIGERPWMIGSLVAGAIVASLCVLLAFETRIAAVEAVAKWSLFTLLFDAESFLTARIGLQVVYANVLACFAAPALLPLLVHQYTRANLLRFPFADATIDVTRWCLIFICMQVALLLLKFLHMVAPVLPQVPIGLPRPHYRYGPVFDVHADDNLVILIVAGVTYSAAVLGSAWPLLVRRIISNFVKSGWRSPDGR
jgi:hypothetical protein